MNIFLTLNPLQSFSDIGSERPIINLKKDNHYLRIKNINITIVVFSRAFCLFMLLAMLACAHLKAQPGSKDEELQAAQRLQESFVWTQAEPPQQQEYAVFRKTFDLDKVPTKCTFRLFADTRYLLWINGEYVQRGPCRFDPKQPEYDLQDVTSFMRSGKNAIIILVYYAACIPINKSYGPPDNWPHQCWFMMAHRPGLAAELEFTHSEGRKSYQATNTTWHYTTKTRYLHSTPSSRGVHENIDARLDSGDWTAINFDDSAWEKATPLSSQLWGPLRPRSIPLLREDEVKNLTLVDSKPIAIIQGPLEKLLPLELLSGTEVVIDCGRQIQAYTALDFDASAGSRLEISYATRFFDTGRIPFFGRGGTEYRTAHHYTTSEGRQSFMSMDTYGFKYIVLRVAEGKIKIHKLRIVDRLYPFQKLGRFTSNDDILDRIWQIGVRTVEVCSEDAHVDCSDSERNEWMADGYKMGYQVSRIALAGPGDKGRPYYADGRLLKNMLRHVAYSQLPDGRLQPMRPSEYPIHGQHGVIDDYSCLWVQAVAELYRRDGDLELATEVWPVMIKALDYYIKRITNRGLVYAMEFVYFNNPLAYVTCEGATINAYFYQSLLDASELAVALKDPSNAVRFAAIAKKLGSAYNNQLWDKLARSYLGAIVSKHVPVPIDDPPTWTLPCKMPIDSMERTAPTGHAALMALYYNLVPPEQKEWVLAFMQERFPTEHPFPYTYVFYLETLYRQDSEEMDRAALQAVRDKWTHMTKYETGTTSEGWSGGSYVHESGAHPSYFLSSYVLGVRTEGPREARRLIVDPRLGDLNRAEGTTLTEFGPVNVKWRRDMNQTLTFEIDNLTNVPAIVSLRLHGKNTSLIVDGKSLLSNGSPTVNKVRVQDRRVSFPLAPGKHSGKIKT